MMYIHLIEKIVKMCHEMIEEFKICDFSFWRKKIIDYETCICWFVILLHVDTLL
jgi:hypothetical protein